MSDIERQIERESNAVRDALIRLDDYKLATDLKPVNDLMAGSLDSLADAILRVQIDLTAADGQRLLCWGAALSSLSHRQFALITLATLLNYIFRSQFEDGVAPPLTTVAFATGEWCRTERMLDCGQGRQLDVADVLASRSRNRNARLRANEFARRVDNPDDWSTDDVSYHLGLKLVAMALEHARFNGQPIFEMKLTQDGSGKAFKTTKRIALTPEAADWIANHPAALAFLPRPAHSPMVAQPRPWTSYFADGGYLRIPLKLPKREPRGKAKRLFQKSDCSIVVSAANALQNTNYQINRAVCEVMQRFYESGHMSFGLDTYSSGELRAYNPDEAVQAEPTETFVVALEGNAV